MTCLDEDGNDVFASYKQSIQNTFVFKDENMLFYNEYDYKRTSSTGCTNNTPIIIGVVVVVVIVIGVLIVIRSKSICCFYGVID